jgi:hypothetical protein
MPQARKRFGAGHDIDRVLETGKIFCQVMDESCTRTGGFTSSEPIIDMLAGAPTLTLRLTCRRAVLFFGLMQIGVQPRAIQTVQLPRRH